MVNLFIDFLKAIRINAIEKFQKNSYFHFQNSLIFHSSKFSKQFVFLIKIYIYNENKTI